MQVTVPDGIGPGMDFLVNTPAGQMQVTCPDGVSAGGQMIVNVAPVVQATAAPLAGPPVVGAPVPMQMESSTTAASDTTLRFPVGAEQHFAKTQLKEMTTGGVPTVLAARGMTEGQWADCCAALNAVVDAQFFKDCPSLECFYWCVPGGPVQCALCLLNPVTCVVCIRPVEKAKRACKATCNPILSPYGYTVQIPDGTEDFVVFAPS